MSSDIVSGSPSQKIGQRRQLFVLRLQMYNYIREWVKRLVLVERWLAPILLCPSRLRAPSF